MLAGIIPENNRISEPYHLAAVVFEVVDCFGYVAVRILPGFSDLVNFESRQFESPVSHFLSGSE